MRSTSGLEVEPEARQVDAVERGRPAFTPMYQRSARERARGHEFARAERLSAWLGSKHRNEMRESRNRTVEHFRATAPIPFLAVAGERQRESSEPREHIRPQLPDRARLADEERRVQRAGGDGIGRLELPPRKWRLDDLKAMRDPVDAREHRGRISRHGRCGAKAYDDLRLDAGFEQAADPIAAARLGQVDDRAVVYVAPHGSSDTENRPEIPVAEADLATDGALTVAEPRAVHEVGHFVGRGDVESRDAAADRRERAAAIARDLDLIRQGLQIHGASVRRKNRRSESSSGSLIVPRSCRPILRSTLADASLSMSAIAAILLSANFSRPSCMTARPASVA